MVRTVGFAPPPGRGWRAASPGKGSLAMRRWLSLLGVALLLAGCERAPTPVSRPSAERVEGPVRPEGDRLSLTPPVVGAAAVALSADGRLALVGYAERRDGHGQPYGL